MKRQNGNRYERGRHHQVSDRLRYRGYREDDWDNPHRSNRAKVHNELHHTSLDDDWDICPGRDSMALRSHSNCAVRHRIYTRRNRGRMLFNLTTEELHHQPQWVQHGHHQNLAWDLRADNWGWRHGRYRYVDYDKVLAALTLAVAEPDKLWTLEYYRHDYCHHGYYGDLGVGGSEHRSIVLSDLDSWLRSQSQPPRCHTYGPLKGQQREDAPRTYPHRYGFYNHICKTLKDFGYDVYQEK